MALVTVLRQQWPDTLLEEVDAGRVLEPCRFGRGGRAPGHPKCDSGDHAGSRGSHGHLVRLDNSASWPTIRKAAAIQLPYLPGGGGQAPSLLGVRMWKRPRGHQLFRERKLRWV